MLPLSSSTRVLLTIVDPLARRKLNTGKSTAASSSSCVFSFSCLSPQIRGGIATSRRVEACSDINHRRRPRFFCSSSPIEFSLDNNPTRQQPTQPNQFRRRRVASQPPHINGTTPRTNQRANPTLGNQPGQLHHLTLSSLSSTLSSFFRPYQDEEDCWSSCTPGCWAWNVASFCGQQLVDAGDADADPHVARL